MNTALRICQERHDYAETPVPWIETRHGQDWLKFGVSCLILGLDVTISFTPKVAVKAADFISEFSQRAAEFYGNDTTFALDWALARGNAVGCKAYQDLAQEVAEQMLMKHVDAAQQSHRFLEGKP